jgi:hypothetical protein
MKTSGFAVNVVRRLQNYSMKEVGRGLAMKSNSTNKVYLCQRCKAEVRGRHLLTHDRVCAYLEDLAKSVIDDLLAELELQ